MAEEAFNFVFTTKWFALAILAKRVLNSLFTSGKLGLVSIPLKKRKREPAAKRFTTR